MSDSNSIHRDPFADADRQLRLLVAGASVRAAVQSAQRAGWRQIVAADLFQDRDLGLAQRCPLASDYGNLPSEAVRLGAEAWMFCGALENRPDLVEQVPVPLLGCRPAVLRAVRDPWQVVEVLRGAGLPTIELARHSYHLPHDGSWLRKRIASAAGRSIVPLIGSEPTASREPVYFQRRIAGTPVSAVYVAAELRCRLLGTTRQWTGSVNPGDGGFHYLGSIGPEPLDGPMRAQWERIGEVLTERFALQGLFGVDAVVAQDRVLPVEVNPRITASVEILERANGWNAWKIHWAACREGRLPSVTHRPVPMLAAKRILFAPRDLWVSDMFLTWSAAQNSSEAWPVLADLPAAPVRLSRGAPVLTVLAGPRPGDDFERLSNEVADRFHAVVAALEAPIAPEKPRATSR